MAEDTCGRWRCAAGYRSFGNIFAVRARRRLHIFAPFLFFAKRGAVNAVWVCAFQARMCAPLLPPSRHATATMSTTDAASVLGLESYIGPLGDMTVAKPKIQQSFDHCQLNPARLELKRRLRAGSFEGGHVDLARQLLERIKSLQRMRDQRDRRRRCVEEGRQVRMSCTAVSLFFSLCRQSRTTVPRRQFTLATVLSSRLAQQL